VRFRPATTDLVARAFAEAVVEGDLAAAEGWIATAAYAAEREQERRHARRGARPRRLRAPAGSIRVVRV